MTKENPYTINEDAFVRTLDNQNYAEWMAKELLKGPRPPKPVVPSHFNGKLVSELNEDEKQAFYLSMQPESTKTALKRDPKDDADHWNREIFDWKAIPDADMETEEGRDKGVAIRSVDPNDADDYRAAKKGKNTLGMSTTSGFSKETKEKSVWAYTYSKPADLTPEEKRKVTKLTPMESTLLEPEKPKKKSILRRCFGWLERQDNVAASILHGHKDEE